MDKQQWKPITPNKTGKQKHNTEWKKVTKDSLHYETVYIKLKHKQK